MKAFDDEAPVGATASAKLGQSPARCAMTGQDGDRNPAIAASKVWPGF
jgi:hypothetical protein